MTVVRPSLTVRMTRFRSPPPPLLDCVVQRPPARAECGVDDHEEEKYEGVDDSGPDVCGAGTVRAPKPLRHRPDDEAQQNAAGVGEFAYESENEREPQGQFEQADRRHEESGSCADGLAPETEPRLQPGRLTLACVGNHLGQRVRETGLEFEATIDNPNEAEDNPHSGLQGASMLHEPVVEGNLD